MSRDRELKEEDERNKMLLINIFNYENNGASLK